MFESKRTKSNLFIAGLLILGVFRGAAAGPAAAKMEPTRASSGEPAALEQILRENAHFFGILVSLSYTAAISEPYWGIGVKNINLNLITRAVRDERGRQLVRVRVAGVVRKNNNVELTLLDEKGIPVGRGFLGYDSGQLTFHDSQDRIIIDGFFGGYGDFELHDLRLPAGEDLLVRGFVEDCYGCFSMAYAWFDAAGVQAGGGRMYPSIYPDGVLMYWSFDLGYLGAGRPAYGEAEYWLKGESTGAVNSALFDTPRGAASYFANPYNLVPDPPGRAYLPRFSDATGIAVTNPGSRGITVTFTARRFNGAPVAGDGIQNPVSYTFAAGIQAAAFPSEIFRGFNPRDHRPILPPGEAGWMEIVSEDGAIQAMFLEEGSGDEALDGNVGASEGAEALVFSDLALQPGESTEIVLANLSYDDTRVRLELLDREGRLLREEPELFIAGRGMRNFFVGPGSQLLRIEDFSRVGSLRVSCGGKNASTPGMCAPLIGLALSWDRFGSLAASYAISRQDADQETVGPYFACGGAGGGVWHSTLRVVRLDGGGGPVYVDLFGANGQPLATFEAVLAAGGSAEFLLEPGRVPWADRFTTGYARVRAASGKIGGSMEIAWSDGRGSQRSIAPLMSLRQSAFRFGQVAEGRAGSIRYWTGLALTNDSNRAASVLLEVWRPDGSLDRSTLLDVPSNGQRVGLLSQILNLPGYERLDGYITATSSEPIRAVAFYGDSESRFLSVIPASGPP